VAPVQAAQNVAQVFLGINLKCASCHDSFISDWKLADAYAFANVFAKEPLEVHRCDKPTGKMAGTAFLFPELGRVDPEAERSVRLEQVARAMTHPKNGRLARTIVNRLWARFFGYGLVEPVDEMDNSPWSADLLDWLAVDLVDNDWNLEHTMARILTSRAYRLPAVSYSEDPRDAPEGYVFRGPLVRRLGAEQFLDAVSQVVSPVYPASSKEAWKPAAELGEGDTAPWSLADDLTSSVASLSIEQETPGSVGTRPQWIWNDPAAATTAPPGHCHFRRVVHLSSRPVRAEAIVTANNRWTLQINGAEAGAHRKWSEPQVLRDLADSFLEGPNALALRARNDGAEPSSAGLWLLMVLEFDGGQPPLVIRSDGSWLCASAAPLGWELASFQELAESTRAALVPNDPFQSALGRPAREQVLTSRASRATLLEMLELANGDAFSTVIRVGAKRLHAEKGDSVEQLVTELIREALGREPADEERRLAKVALGDRLSQEGLEDLLWAVLLLPEFQLIY